MKAKSPMPVFVDRREFITWLEGYALKRSATDCIAPNEELCEKAEKAIEDGKPVVLTVNHVPYSTIVTNKEGENVEKRLKDVKLV